MTPLHLACINPKSTKALNEIYVACPDLQLTDDQGTYVDFFTSTLFSTQNISSD